MAGKILPLLLAIGAAVAVPLGGSSDARDQQNTLELDEKVLTLEQQKLDEKREQRLLDEKRLALERRRLAMQSGLDAPPGRGSSALEPPEQREGAQQEAAHTDALDQQLAGLASRTQAMAAQQREYRGSAARSSMPGHVRARGAPVAKADKGGESGGAAAQGALTKYTDAAADGLSQLGPEGAIAGAALKAGNALVDFAFNPDPYSFGQEAGKHADEAMQKSQEAVDKLNDVLKTQRDQLDQANKQSLSDLANQMKALDPKVTHFARVRDLP